MKKLSLILLLALACTACTENQRARNFGGTAYEDLPKGQKFVNATWKQDSLWVVTRPMREDELPENFALNESSSFGLVQGTVVFRESK